MGEQHAPLVWIDLEMTGLEPASCAILEIATVVTNVDLEVKAKGPNLVIHQPDEVLEQMNDWCKEHHAASGLSARVKASPVSNEDAEEQTLSFLRAHTESGVSPLCGNSIGLDKRFIIQHMPKLNAFLADILIDVTSIKELSRRWYPKAKPPEKNDQHRALDDILESIAELSYYRKTLFR